MTQRQRKAIVIGLLVIALMFIFPPMYGPHDYNFFFADWTIRQQRLGLQVFITIVLTGAYIVFLGGKQD